MSATDAIQHALREAGIDAHITGTRDLSGGCIHQVMEVTLSNGQRAVAKVNRSQQLKLFEEEAHGLQALAATNTVLVPQPLTVIAHGGAAVLLMTAIVSAGRSANATTWSRFGEGLAALHHADAYAAIRQSQSDRPRYGFDRDNHIGSTLQPNGWRDDWVEFNAVNRLGFQLNAAVENDLLDASESQAVQTVIDRLDQFVPRRPKPALVHGDLWSGNALPASDDRGERIAVIDPACSIGDGWADIAMMRLFGGFPQACYDAYAANNTDHDQIEQRIAVYQLYHVLNHVNIFGRGYVGQAMEIARRLVAR